MANEPKAVELLLSGQVVGIGLRNWTRVLAGQTGVSGWVHNNLDRTVSVHAEGPGEAVDSFVERMKRPGLEAANVTNVDVQEAEIHGYTDFEVEY